MEFLNKDNKIVPLEINLKEDKRKIDFEFQALGIELEPYYGKVIWSLFYKYPLLKIKDAHKVCKERGIFKLAYLIGVIQKLK